VGVAKKNWIAGGAIPRVLGGNGREGERKRGRKERQRGRGGSAGGKEARAAKKERIDIT